MKKKRQILLRIDTKANWLKANPKLGKGEMVIIEDLNNSIVVGDGATEFKNLKIQGYDGNIAKELGISDDKVISQRVVTEELDRKLERVELSNIVEGVKITRPEEPVVTPGKLVYDRTSKLFLWEVVYSGVTEKAYFTKSSIEELAGTSPKVGAVYILGDAVYVGIAEGLSEKFMSMEEVDRRLNAQDTEINRQGTFLNQETTSLQNQINAIVAGNTKLTVTVSPTMFFEKVSTEVTVTARLVGEKGKITLLGQTSGELVSEFSVKETITTTKSYTATAVVKGNTIKSNTVTANAYKPFYVGAGANMGAVKVEKYKHGPSSNARGTYTFDAVFNDKIYLILPNGMPEPKVKFTTGGFDLPVALSQTETLEGYQIYVSGKREARTYTITII